MLQKVKEEIPALEDVMATAPSARFNRLRADYLSPEWVASIDRERVEVEVLKATEGEELVLRKAKVFAAIVREVPVEVFEDELIVGWFDYEAHGCALPVKGDPGLDSRLDILTSRERNPVTITEEQQRILREEIMPYWRGDGKHLLRRNSALYDNPPLPEIRELMYFDGSQRPNGIINSSRQKGGHVGHTIANHQKVLDKGFLGMKKEAEDRLARLDRSDPEELKKAPFLNGVIIAMEAAAEIGGRFADRARALAETESDPVRREELLAIAKVCDRIPAHPAKTFHEAIQVTWFIHILHWWETRDTAAISPGRVDQYLYPFYRRDLEEGRITEAGAQELIDAFLLRFSRYRAAAIAEPSGQLGEALWGNTHHIDVGGYKPDGTDATNDLSYMFIEGMMHCRMQEPNFGILVHSNTPESLLIKACELCSLGAGHPMFLNNDAIITSMLSRGTLGGPPITLELARKASAFGCNEPCVPGMDSGFAICISAPAIQAFELTLRNGIRKKYNRQEGPITGDPKSFETFEEFRAAFEEQVSWLVEKTSIAQNLIEPLIAEFDPTVFQSALIDDCVEKGICREAGGARFNFGPFTSLIGSADIGDSLAAVKKLLYEDKTVTWDELMDALDNNFEGHEALRQKLLDVPKFGNDDDYADEQTAWVRHVYAQETIKHKNTRGGHRVPFEIPLGGYVAAGARVGALPSGRLAGQPLADSCGPTMGSDLNGPTSIIKSVGKVNNAEIYGGQTLNLRLDPDIFEDKMGSKRMADFIRTFIDLKLHHVQINIVSSDILRAAQEDPKNHRDLMVRVAGYVAQFVELPRNVQDTIIARSEHKL
jgi:pyruvate formate-lyase/glycerol dehydratase family glycyl radical enzyme